jgi:thiamine kinase-like enzyme
MDRKQVGAGVSSEVFEWSDGNVVKLFRPKYSHLARTEAKRAAAVHAAGIPSPRVVEVIEVDGRNGIVFERIFGDSLLATVKADPSRAGAVAMQLAELHIELHQRRIPELPDLIASLSERLSSLPGKLQDRFRVLLSSLPQGDQVFHGDFHPGNILQADRPVIVDWLNACSSHPALDVGRSLVLIRYEGVRADLQASDPEDTREPIARAYLDRYVALSDVSLQEINRCEGFWAATLLLREPSHPLRERLTELASRV